MDRQDVNEIVADAEVLGRLVDANIPQDGIDAAMQAIADHRSGRGCYYSGRQTRVYLAVSAILNQV